MKSLRDPDTDIQEAARSALEAVEFYFAQELRWKKWLEGVGIDSGNAAEALLAQAAADQPKKQRLLGSRIARDSCGA